MGQNKKSILKRIFGEHFFATSEKLDDNFELPDPRFDESNEVHKKYSTGDFRALPKTPVNDSIRMALVADLKLMTPEKNVVVFPVFSVQAAKAAGYDISQYPAGKHDSIYRQNPNQIHIVTFDTPDPDMNTARHKLCVSLLAGRYSRLSENGHEFHRGSCFYDLISDMNLPIPKEVEDTHAYSEIVTETEYSAALYILKAAFRYMGKQDLPAQMDRSIQATPLEISVTIAQKEEERQDGGNAGGLYPSDPVFTGLYKQIYGEIIMDRCAELVDVLRSPSVDILKFNELMSRYLIAAREELYEAIPAIYELTVQWWGKNAKATLDRIIEDNDIGADKELSEVFNLDYTKLAYEDYPSWLQRMDIGSYIRKDLGIKQSGYDHIARITDPDSPVPGP